MNQLETAKLLALATTLDHITRTADDVQAWAFVLADVAYPDAVNALRAHFADPEHGTEYLKPAHITRQLAAARPSVQLPPRSDLGECSVHTGYPMTTSDGRCEQCIRHPEDLLPGAPAPELVRFDAARLTAGRTA